MKWVHGAYTKYAGLREREIKNLVVCHMYESWQRVWAAVIDAIEKHQKRKFQSQNPIKWLKNIFLVICHKTAFIFIDTMLAEKKLLLQKVKIFLIALVIDLNVAQESHFHFFASIAMTMILANNYRAFLLLKICVNVRAERKKNIKTFTILQTRFLHQKWRTL